ncbi:MAG: 16S rRNA (guanine(966)-N(2))-methyltransferase RsmD, partial [Merismopedia sp. SIO2A8]|nr:16S rRNA (guanine(966)-N(2))-methyltransferase RsmD [Merismopedia sp. SIO2A8]
MSIRIHGNRSLKTLPGKQTRPTPAKVRQALFNIWQGEIVDCRWLDLCAGSGAMGAEALCRGAIAVTGIEQSSPACAIIHQNWKQVTQPHQTIRLMRGHILKQLPKLNGQQFDRIYFDPPYTSDLYRPVLEAIATYALLANGGELAVEHHPDKCPPPNISSASQYQGKSVDLKTIRSKQYGSTAI